MCKINWNTAQYEVSSAEASQLPTSSLPEIAFSGRSNVGKSSLINALTNRKMLAYTSSTPGKTATINFFNLECFRLVDLPGYGYAKVSKSEKERWSSLIHGYFNSTRDLRLVIQLVDVRHKPTKDDYQMIDYMIDWEIPFVIALTKTDKLKPKARKERFIELQSDFKKYEGLRLIPFSSVTREGKDELQEIVQYVVTGINTNIEEV